jgi:hypothetical protein
MHLRTRKLLSDVPAFGGEILCNFLINARVQCTLNT